jgi:GNAT superfamily N-acetyltransferase
MSLELKKLPPSEWGQLKAVFVEEFGTDEMPDPATTEIYAAYDGGRLICFFPLETVVHAGPFWVRPAYRGTGLAREMAEEALKLTEGREGYITATRPEIEHLAEDLGLTKIKGTLWCKEAGHVR